MYKCTRRVLQAARFSFDRNPSVLSVAESGRGGYKALILCAFLGRYVCGTFCILLTACWRNILRPSSRRVSFASEEKAEQLGIAGSRWGEESTAGIVCKHL